MATVDMNSNRLDILHYQNPLFPGSRPALSCGDVWAVGTISSRTQEPSPYNAEDVVVPYDYFKSAVAALDQKNDFGSQYETGEDNALRAPGIKDNNHSSNDDEIDDHLRTTKSLDYSLHKEVSTGYQSPQQNRQYSHDFTPDASDSLTGLIQSRFGEGLGSKDRPVVLEKDERDNTEDTEAAYSKFDDEDSNCGGLGLPSSLRIAARPPRFEKWYDVEEGCYVVEEVLEKEEVVARSEGREGEWGNQNQEAEAVVMVATAEESGNSKEERDGSANSDDGYDHNNTESVQDAEGKQYTPKDPNILPSDSEGRMLMGYSEQQKSSSNKRHDLNARLTDSMPGWMALQVAARCEDSAAAEQDLGDAGFLITISQITADVMCEMACPISREIERRVQELPNSLKRQWFSGDEEGLRASWHCHNTFDDSYLPSKPPKKRGRPATQPQSPKAKKRGRPASQAQPPQAKKRGRPPKARALHG